MTDLIYHITSPKLSFNECCSWIFLTHYVNVLYMFFIPKLTCFSCIGLSLLPPSIRHCSPCCSISRVAISNHKHNISLHLSFFNCSPAKTRNSRLLNSVQSSCFVLKWNQANTILHHHLNTLSHVELPNVPMSPLYFEMHDFPKYPSITPPSSKYFEACQTAQYTHVAFVL